MSKIHEALNALEEIKKAINDAYEAGYYEGKLQSNNWVSLSDEQHKDIIKQECRYTSEAAQIDHKRLSYAVEDKIRKLNETK